MCCQQLRTDLQSFYQHSAPLDNGRKVLFIGLCTNVDKGLKLQKPLHGLCTPTLLDYYRPYIYIKASHASNVFPFLQNLVSYKTQKICAFGQIMQLSNLLIQTQFFKFPIISNSKSLSLDLPFTVFTIGYMYFELWLFPAMFPVRVQSMNK